MVRRAVKRRLPRLPRQDRIGRGSNEPEQVQGVMAVIAVSDMDSARYFYEGRVALLVGEDKGLSSTRAISGAE